MLTIVKLPFPRYIGLKHAKFYVLPEPLIAEQWIVQSGTEVRLFQSRNFGLVVLPKGAKDVRGFEIPRRLFRW